MSNLTAANVEKVFIDCLFKKEEVLRNEHKENSIVIKGVAHTFTFHPERVKQNTSKVKEFIEELPEVIHLGMSFLQMIYSKSGEHWAEHHHVELLMVLGLATKTLDHLIPPSELKDSSSQMPVLVAV
ncbi:hypothetical protein U8V72_14390 [Priestia filamentosa]|uniref:hypothetical protein n=1 Tax=Priestia filamentosa TaxID=1402861 RepID=UPI00397D5C17